MAQQNARLNTDLDNKLTSSYYDGTDWYVQTKAKDGAISTLGTTTDADATGNGTLVGIIKRIRTLFGGGLPSALSTGGNLKTAVTEPLPSGDNNIGNVDVISSALPTGAATAAKQDAIIGAVDGLEGLITAIRDTDGIKKIADALPSGDNNIGNIDIVSTPADATHGSGQPAKAFMIAGSDGVNARNILVDENGVVQVQLVQTAQEVAVLPSEARTASGDTSATPIDVGKYKEALFFLDVTDVAGTSPTLDVAIKTKDPISGKWFDLVSFAQVTAISSEMKAVNGLIGSQIAAFYTIAGDTPSFTFSLGAVLKS